MLQPRNPLALVVATFVILGSAVPAQQPLSAQQQQRLEQLRLQSQGYNAFDDPHLQSALKMTPEQVRRMQIVHAEYQRQLAPLLDGFQANPQATLREYRMLREQMEAQLRSILSQDQREVLADLIKQALQAAPR